MKRLLAFAILIIAAAHLHAQEHPKLKIGLQLGFSPAPKGLSIAYIPKHHHQLDFAIGFDKKFDTGEDLTGRTGFFENGATLISAAYQPYGQVGNDRATFVFYGNAGARLRINHMPQSGEFKAFAGHVTPDLMIGGGLAGIFFHRIEVFVTANFIYYDPTYGGVRDHNYHPGFDGTIGLRYCLF